MGLPSGQQRALDQIEKTLADDHPSLGPLFAVFTRLTDHEAMPVTERITARLRWRRLRWRQRRMRSAVVGVVGLAMAIGALLSLSLTLTRPSECPGAVTPVAGYSRAVPTGRQPACAPQQDKPRATRQSGLDAH